MAKKKETTKKEKNEKSTKVVEKDVTSKSSVSKINRFNILFVDLQVVFTILTVAMLIWYAFDASAWHFLQIIFGITMIIIGYNNKIIYNRPKFAWVYYVTGIVLIVCDILMLLGIGV